MMPTWFRRAGLCSRPGSQAGGIAVTGGLAALALALCSTGAFASEPRVVAVGSRVRVSAPETGSARLIGTVVGLEPRAILVQAESGRARTRVAVGPAATIEISGGRRSKARRGAVLGAAAGAMPGLLMTFGDYNSDPGQSPGVVAAVGAAAGAAVGAAIGWALKSEEWLPAEVPPVAAGVVPVRGGVGVSVHVAWGRRHSPPRH